jgi:hypothetical protein
MLRLTQNVDAEKILNPLVLNFHVYKIVSNNGSIATI